MCVCVCFNCALKNAIMKHICGFSLCTALSAYGEYGFRVAVWASVVSSCVIVVLSMAFIVCCLHARFKTKTRKRSHQKR